MEAKTQLRKPENWQDFERLCKVLWGEIWECPDTIKRNGRQGQAQKGVDIYGIKKGECVYRGIQCKGKDDYTNSQLTESEIDNEIAKALLFTPKLKSFYFATTANKDAHIEEYIRNKNLESISNGGFEIDIFAWEDIVDLIEAHRNIYNWYLNNCSYKDVSDVDVFIDWKKEYTIYPEYYRITREYYLKPQNMFFISQEELRLLKTNTQFMSLNNVLNPPSKHDYRWCTIPINIYNIGKTVIENYKLSIIIENVLEISDKFHYYNSRLMDQAAVAQINARKDAQREVFESTEYCNVIEYRPKERILVQDDHRTFKIAVKPKDNVQSIKIRWILYSRNYKKEGELLLNVEPKFEDKKEKVEVDNIDELKENEVIISPKIVKK
ncbi:hypothetical protein [Capnocytophaga gingivalis]|uniref:Mrr-like domain-containing protein n=1 Tax=Capnocytophaga gingivalis TaxID=1017 RepID=A0ABU5ZBV2_9FLAO|nr:hypothetical protein [Capnocytophaga gingivalis]MEB3076442.1 hypothetical protein [Capnocytophaga gingivalis]